MGRLTLDVPTELGDVDAGSPAGEGPVRRREGLAEIRRRATVDRFVSWVETWSGR
jgi:hypothetical protein